MKKEYKKPAFKILDKQPDSFPHTSLLDNFAIRCLRYLSLDRF